MKVQQIIFIFFLLVFILIVDLYTYRGLSKVLQPQGNQQQRLIFYSFWGITVFTLLWLGYIFLRFKSLEYNAFFRMVMIFFGFFVLLYVPKLFFNVFQILRDVGRLIGVGIEAGLNDNSSLIDHVRRVSRSDFLLQLGLIISTVSLLFIIYGIGFGRFNYKVERLELFFPDLPAAFDGTKIVQISDLHLGSMSGKTEKLEKAVKIINGLDADYVLFTGDIVNNLASEVPEFIPVLSEIKVREGKYSILGNHDYAEYYQWSSEDDRQKNMEDLYRYHEEAGFRLLRNESVILRSDSAQIGLAGVENWGKPPFPQYGDLNKAWNGIRNLPFKILMSHDPSHWEEEVLPQTDIDLTLSGHTHGMQFAINIPGWRWSPVKMKYPRWAGLYEQNDQYLYVNIGLGYIAFPGRVGTPPEITFFTLRSGNKN